jgi:hypothetical protein
MNSRFFTLYGRTGPLGSPEEAASCSSACCKGMISEYRTVPPGSCRDSTMISLLRTAKRSPRRQPRDSPRCQAR